MAEPRESAALLGTPKANRVAGVKWFSPPQAAVEALAVGAGGAIANVHRTKCAWIGGMFICARCKARVEALVNSAKRP